MQNLNKVISFISGRLSLLFFLVLIVFTIDRANRWFDNNNGNFPFVNDVDQYYSYLPAAFIHHDLSFRFPHSYWTKELPNGNLIPKGTMGMAIMYSPFFWIGHTIAKSKHLAQDGYTLPYKWSIHIGSLLYAFLGLWFCRKSLLIYFSELITAITLLCVFFGTNLFYYTYAYGEMPHSYLFFIFSAFIYFVIRWHQTKKLKFLLLFSFLAGFATLIRPSECLLLLFPLLFEVKSVSCLKERCALIFSYGLKLLPAFILFMIPFCLQMYYWKTYTGQWLFFSYGSEERFFWGDPKIMDFLFGFRKGWFIYTPMMLFAMGGIIIMFKKWKGMFYFLTLYLLLQIYMLSCWWDWPFGGSFGCRVLIQHYAFLTFGLAVFLKTIFAMAEQKKWLNISVRIITVVVLAFVINLNLDQSWQYKYEIIHYNGMTREAYFYVLGKKELSPAERAEFQKLIRPPDYAKMIKGERDLE